MNIIEQLQIQQQNKNLTNTKQDQNLLNVKQQLANTQGGGDHISFPKIKRQSQHTDQHSDDNFSLSQQPLIEDNIISKQQELKMKSMDSYMEELSQQTPNMQQFINQNSQFSQHQPTLQSQQAIRDNFSAYSVSNKNAPFQNFNNNLRSLTTGGSQGGSMIIVNNQQQNVIQASNILMSRQGQVQSELSKIKVQTFENEDLIDKRKRSEENEEEDSEEEELKQNENLLLQQLNNQLSIDQNSKIEILNQQIPQNISQIYEQSQEALDKPSEVQVVDKIYEAIFLKHDLLGNKKGLPYKKFKHHTLTELSYEEKTQEDLFLIRQQVIINDERLKSNKQQYLNYVQKRLNYSIDSSPKSTERLKVKPTLINLSTKPLEVSGINYDQASLIETTKKHYEYNRLEDALKFKTIRKDQILRENNHKLQSINQSLQDPNEHSQYNATHILFSKKQIPQVRYDDGSIPQSMSITIGGMQLATNSSFNQKSTMGDGFRGKSLSYQNDNRFKNSDQYSLRTTIYNSKDSKIPKSNRVQLNQIEIMLPILNKDRCIYKVEQLNCESIKDQRKLNPLLSFKSKQQKLKSHRASSMNDSHSQLDNIQNQVHCDKTTTMSFSKNQNQHKNYSNEIYNISYDKYVKKQSQGFSTENKNQFRSLIGSKKKQSTQIQDQINKKKQQQLQLEKLEEIKFMNEIKFLASKMAEL
eukprot:403345424